MGDRIIGLIRHGIWPGERVLTMGPGKAARLKALGADHMADYREHPAWKRLIPDLTGGRGAAYATIRRIFAGSRASFEAMNRAIAFHKIRPVIDHVAPFEETAGALREFKAAKHFGKIVLSLA